MKYLHIKNIEKYNMGFKDRQHIWAKIYYNAFLDEKFQALSEIDRYRFWSLVVFEVYHRKPVALTRVNQALLGWDNKKRPISMTLQMLHTIVEVCNESDNKSVSQSRVEESRIEKSNVHFDFDSVYNKYPKKIGRKAAERHFNISVKTQEDYDKIEIALENYINSETVTKGFIQNASTWFNNWTDWIENPVKGENDGIPKELRSFVKKN